MRIAFAVLGLASALLFSTSAQAACSVEQRIELAKAGYEKSEVERLCAEEDLAKPAATPSSVEPAKPESILERATYDGYDPARDPGRARTNIGPEQQCEFHDGFVRMNGFKQRSDGYEARDYEAKDFPDNATGVTMRKFDAKPKKGAVYAFIQITGVSGMFKSQGTCWAMFARSENMSANDFSSAEAGLRREFDAVLRALAAKGID